MESYHPVDTLMAAGAIEFIVFFDGQAMVKDIEFYRSKIGFLMYLVTQTKPDIAYGVFVLS